MMCYGVQAVIANSVNDFFFQFINRLFIQYMGKCITRPKVQQMKVKYVRLKNILNICNIYRERGEKEMNR